MAGGDKVLMNPLAIGYRRGKMFKSLALRTGNSDNSFVRARTHEFS
jgi:hypothetical protein